MGHLMCVVVKADDCFALFDPRQQHHQCSVRHDKVEVVPREVKIYSLKGVCVWGGDTRILHTTHTTACVSIYSETSPFLKQQLTLESLFSI